MFVCKECGGLFETPILHTETHGLEYPPYETWHGCPSCGGNFTPAVKCDCCGEYIVWTHVRTDNGKFYCFECYNVVDLKDYE